MHRIRRKNCSYCIVALSGIASLLLLGERTSHSKFKIFVPSLDNSTCNIEKDSKQSHLLVATDMIIWDETPMSHKNYFETLDRTLKDVMSYQGLENMIFGGKVVILEEILDKFFLLFQEEITLI